MNIGTMRSSKSRSRNKSRNNPRSLGNIVNRVFDSSGPEGKVRGTPQQIIEKYLALARDAQLSGDRVAEQGLVLAALVHRKRHEVVLPLAGGEVDRDAGQKKLRLAGAVLQRRAVGDLHRLDARALGGEPTALARSEMAAVFGAISSSF